jgi:hypothetical protein
MRRMALFGDAGSGVDFRAERVPMGTLGFRESALRLDSRLQRAVLVKWDARIAVEWILGFKLAGC